jgi:hypothetical protein
VRRVVQKATLLPLSPQRGADRGDPAKAAFAGMTSDGIVRAVERKSIRANSLFGRIKSLFSKIGFPVLDELIPCSVAQGINFREPHKLLNSQMFSVPVFRRERPKSNEFAVVSLM